MICQGCLGPERSAYKEIRSLEANNYACRRFSVRQMIEWHRRERRGKFCLITLYETVLEFCANYNHYPIPLLISFPLYPHLSIWNSSRIPQALRNLHCASGWLKSFGWEGGITFQSTEINFSDMCFLAHT